MMGVAPVGKPSLAAGGPTTKVSNAPPLPFPEKVEPSSVLGGPEYCLLFGPGGTGKTFCAGTAPEPQWWLLPGSGTEMKAVLSPDFIRKHGKKETYRTVITEDRKKGQMSDNPSGYDRCCDAMDAFLEWNYAQNVGVKTIVIDNATRIGEYMMNKAIMAEFELASTKDKTVLTAERKYGIRRPHDSTYGGAQSFMDRWVNWLIELPFNLVFIAHDYSEFKQPAKEDGARGRAEKVLLSVRPNFVGQQRTSIQNKFDNVWYFSTTGGGRSLTFGMQTKRDTVIDCKTRVGGILHPTFHKDPNLTDIIDQFSRYAKTQDPPPEPQDEEEAVAEDMTPEATS